MTNNNQKIFNPSKIADQFCEFYSALYNLCDTPTSFLLNVESLRLFLDSIDLPTMSDTQLAELSSPFIESEVSKAIKSLPLHKSPDPEGFVNEYYIQFHDRLTPHLTDTFNNIIDRGSCPQEFLESTIVTILKPGKPSDNPANYHPISLLNTDTKLYAKILANRIFQFTSTLIHPDQMQFVPGHQTSDGTRSSMKLIQWAEHHNIPSLMISLDAEKSFFRVHWTYMTEVLRRFGFQGRILSAITTLYTCPTASSEPPDSSRLYCPLQMERGKAFLSPLLSLLSLWSC